MEIIEVIENQKSYHHPPLEARLQHGWKQKIASKIGGVLFTRVGVLFLLLLVPAIIPLHPLLCQRILPIKLLHALPLRDPEGC